MTIQKDFQIGADAAIDLLGGEMLTGSGFETESPNPDFAEHSTLR